MSTNPSYENKELIGRIADGDEQAFALLYHEILPVLHSFLFKMLKSETAVQDAVQEAFIRIWMNRDKLPAVEHPRAWMAKVALNECYRLLRKQARLKEKETVLSGEDPPEPDQTTDRIALAETKRLINSAIEELPERRKLIFKMSREQGMKIPEIAAALGLSSGYVKNALVLALQQLRKRLTEEGRILLILLILKNF
ncbi:MAG TPA: RNA polymerase sigma factor [Niastella sp.]